MNSFVEDSCGIGGSCGQRLSKDTRESSKGVLWTGVTEESSACVTELWLTEAFNLSWSYFPGMHNAKFHMILNKDFFFLHFDKSMSIQHAKLEIHSSILLS